MKSEIIYIQYLRGIAALLVVYVHAVEQFPEIKELFNRSLGFAGVDLFFVISGFIMVYSTHQRNISPAKFILRRIERVVPLYWFFTAALISIAFILPSVLESVKLVPIHVFSSFFFIPMSSPVFPDQFWPVLIPGWTLNYEMFFYAIFALSLFYSEKNRIALLSTILFVLVLFGQVFELKGLAEFYTDPILLEFLLGAFIGYLFVHKIIKYNKLIGLALLTLSTLLFIFLHYHTELHRLIHSGIPATILILSVLYLHNDKKVLLSYWLNEIGNASYSIYLSHVFSLGLFRFIRNSLGYGHITDFWIATFAISLAIILSTIIGLLVYKLIEMPINLKLRQRRH